MTSQDNTVKQRRTEHSLRNLPTEVLLKARNTLVSLGGALKPKQDQQLKPKQTKQDKKSHRKLKYCRSDPDFDVLHGNNTPQIKSRTDVNNRETSNAVRPRPLSVGALKRYNSERDEFIGRSPRDVSPLRQKRHESSEDICVQSRLVIPVADRFGSQEVQVQEVNGRPRKKLSFREPEIVGSASATLGRSLKIMGVNSLNKQPNRLSLRVDPKFSSLDGLDSEDLESQAMRIVRTVGQAFEVCHKMQGSTPDQPAPSTSSAIDEPVLTEHTSDTAASKEGASECGASESGAASTSKVVLEEGAVGGADVARPKHLDLLPPPPRKESKRNSTRTTPAPSLNLPELPECVTRVEVGTVEGDAPTPLSAQHQLQLLRERLAQQAQQTRAAVAQLSLLRDQLAAEQAARCEAQARTHQLLVHNKELLEHIAALVAHLQEREHGSSRPISAQQLTLLPQMKFEEAPGESKNEKDDSSNGNKSKHDTESLIDLYTQSDKVSENVENNNIRLTPYNMSPNIPGSPVSGPKTTSSFDKMCHEEIQNYLIDKFQQLDFQQYDFGNDDKNPSPSTFEDNQHFFQNSRAFPNIPPLTSHFSNSDLKNLLSAQMYQDMGSPDEIGATAQPMSLGHSLNSTSQDTSKDSSPTSSEEGVPFIMPLSHNGTLTATSDDGRVRLIVPVSPSPSSSDVMSVQIEAPPSSPSGATLKVPGADRLNPAGPITRSTSEKVPNRSEMMTALRAQWTRHTTK